MRDSKRNTFLRRNEQRNDDKGLKDDRGLTKTLRDSKRNTFLRRNEQRNDDKGLKE